jgi:mannose-1-phosphate guanylyltransferase
MAGGVGSRFWPKSRNHYPKQFIDILGTGQSLLQMTYYRFLKICDPSRIFVLTNNDYASLVLEQLPIDQQNILIEPSRNNTAPCIAYANAKITKLNPDANIVVAPSDHLIIKEEEFLKTLNLALDFSSKNDVLVTLGIQPTRPDTGYGYIKYKSEQGARNKEHIEAIKKVETFVEKPQLEVAEEYLKRGDYLWNAGIFVWNATSLQKAMKSHAPEIYELFQQGDELYGTSDEAGFIEEFYPKSKNISIDFAIMEKANNVYTIPADIGWSDLGTWASLYDISKEDDGNAINTKRKLLEDTENCMISVNNNKGVVIKGLKDFIVVDDDKVLLIYPKSAEQEIKQVSANFVESFGHDFI